MQLTDEQLFEHCQCGCDRDCHHDDGICEQCIRCTQFCSASHENGPSVYTMSTLGVRQFRLGPANREKSFIRVEFFGATRRIRTDDLLITNRKR
jgi:hypothetical protein